MRIAYFDCFSGISGDMILGALLDAGLSFDQLQKELTSLAIEGYGISANSVTKSGFAATKLDVHVNEKQPHRHLANIEKIIHESQLSENIKHEAIKVFDRLAQAEAKVHRTTKENIHFHEVGAVDAIVDVVGCIIGLDLLGVEKVFSSPVSLGTGKVVCQHGEIPVPAPASVELVKGYPVRMTGIEAELTTPTGAALITTLASNFGDMPSMKIDSVGHGAGGRELKERPNILRVFLGETTADLEHDHIMVVETNIDDMNPEIVAYATEKLFEAGALDVFITPMIMKKGRQGQQITVLVDEEKLPIVMDTLFTETSTIGVRMLGMERRKLPHQTKIVETEFGRVKVKVANWKGQTKIAPEFDDCRRIATEQNVSLERVYKAATRAGV
jgi:uncharacterized protein (TIGR00299 family) protein